MTTATQIDDIGKSPIRPMRASDAVQTARLFGDAMPWSIFSKLGVRFNARFIRWIQEQPETEVWTANDASGRVVGITCGSMNKPRVYRTIVRQHFLWLSFNTLINLWRPPVLIWLIRATWGLLRPLPAVKRPVPRPDAEAIFLAVVEEAKGTGVAQRLRQTRDDAFRKWGLKGPYTCLMLASNKRIQAFTKKHGSKFIVEVPTRGHSIYEFHKELPPE